MKNYPLVSVYTCVYNGERTISRVFESMCNLEYPNIEHIIVNDGSSDNTDQLIKEYVSTVQFPVKYHICKENGGKHIALNIAWDLAEGEFMVQLDADDRLYPNAINYLVNVYFHIPEAIRNEYWCVHGRFVTQHGQFVGDKYPEDINEQHWKEAGKEAAKCRRGDKIGLQVRKYLDAYRFPNVVGSTHLPEGIIWTQINEKYGTWYTNEVIAVNYVNEGGNLTGKKTTRKQYAAVCFNYKWKLMNTQLYPKSCTYLLKYSILFFVTSEEYRKNNPYLKGVQQYRMLLNVLSPFAYIVAYFFRKLKKIH